MSQTLKVTPELRQQVAYINKILGEKLEAKKKIKTLNNITDAVVDTLIKNALWFNHAQKMNSEKLLVPLKTKEIINISNYYLYIGLGFASCIQNYQKLPEIERRYVELILKQRYNIYVAAYKSNILRGKLSVAKEQKQLANATKLAFFAVKGKDKNVEMFLKMKQQNAQCDKIIGE